MFFFLVSFVLLILGLVDVSGSNTSISFLVLGDWGGQSYLPPYTTRSEVKTSKVMGKIANVSDTSFIVAVGDNFYENGVNNEFDPRFHQTFEDVFTSKSLYSPWYVVAGNHDHRGNVSGEIYYSNHSSRWNFPDYYYTFTYKIGTKNLQIILIDTVILSGQTTDADYCKQHPQQKCLLQPEAPQNPKLADAQWIWLEKTLSESMSDYILIAGHYPVWSIAEHGPTQSLVSQLRPLLFKYNVTAYLCGHDHTMEYLEEMNENYSDIPVGYVVTGAAHECNPSTEHKDDVPKNSLKYHGCDDGGFVRVDVDENSLQFFYYLGNDEEIKFITRQFKPRVF